MNSLLDDRGRACSTDGEGPAPAAEKGRQETHAQKNGEDQEFRIMDHFVRAFIERQEERDPL